jgi:hypothetical protein
MNGPIAKILLPLLFISAIRISAHAQDTTTPRDTNKVRAVVLPGMQYTNKPAKKYTAPSTSERSGANYNADTSHAKPVRTNTADYNTAPTTAERPGYQDYLHPDPPKHQSALSSGVVTPPPATTTVPVTVPAASAPVQTGGGLAVGPATTSSNTSNTSSTSSKTSDASSTSTNTVTTTTTTTTTLPDGKKVISVKKGDTVYITKTDTINAAADNKVRSMKAIYAEVGGAGLAISANYDNRFGADRKGLGFRIGAGYFSDGYGNTVFTIPMQVNYLFTKDENNFIELGGGTTFLNSTGNNKGPTFIFDKVTGFIGTATLGYRYQPVDHKLNFRIDFVPIFYDEGVIWAGGVSIGYNFK